jgi:hypothetical protein
MKNKFLFFTVMTVFAGFSAFPQTKLNAFADPSIDQYLQKKAATICEDEKLSTANWEPVAERIKDKRIILLGEFNHGSKEIFEVRNDLIKYLHKKIGASVILLESGIGEMAYVDLNKGNLSPAQMTNGFFGNWRTKEFEGLMEFSKANNVSLAGFDVQRTANSFNNLFKKQAEIKKIDSTLYGDLEKKYGLVLRELSNTKAVYDSLKEKIISYWQKIVSMPIQQNYYLHYKPLRTELHTYPTCCNLYSKGILQSDLKPGMLLWLRILFGLLKICILTRK